MGPNCRAPKAQKSTIKYRRLPLDKHLLFEPDAFLTKDRGANHQSQSTQSGSRRTDVRSTTPQLVSALTGIWNLVGQPESSGTDQRSVSDGILHKEDPVCFSGDQKGHTLTSCCAESSAGLSSQTYLPTPNSIYEDLSSVKKILMLRSCSSKVGASSTWRHVHVTSKLGNMHYLLYQNLHPMQTEKMETYAASSNMDIKEDRCFGRYGNYSSQTINMPTEICTSSSEEANISHACESSLHDTKSNVEISGEYFNSSACSFQQIAIGKKETIVLENQISGTCEHTLLEDSTCTSYLVGDAVVVNPSNTDQYTYGEDMSQQHSLDECSPEFESSFQHRFHDAVTANKHAVAGALAGTAVSVSLHPVDTVKTIIQANSSLQSSMYHILRRTLVERGLSLNCSLRCWWLF